MEKPKVPYTMKDLVSDTSRWAAMAQDAATCGDPHRAESLVRQLDGEMRLLTNHGSFAGLYPKLPELLKELTKRAHAATRER